MGQQVKVPIGARKRDADTHSLVKKQAMEVQQPDAHTHIDIACFLSRLTSAGLVCLLFC